jgi:hypothetical protein
MAIFRSIKGGTYAGISTLLRLAPQQKLMRTCRYNIIDLLFSPVAPFGSAGLGVTIWGVPLPS